ncbi:MAG: lipocalin-like domain-containing protein, partial [Saprospiraceae bacterium]|nr:lipocalin-like domain-containing protein [Saprospiraceae bacterium]
MQTALTGALLMLVACDRSAGPVQEVTSALSDADIAGYQRAEHPHNFVFPDDHGAHPLFKHEWWYLTGQVQDPQGRRFGYQFTLFRRALSPYQAPHSSAWATNQLYLAHLALSDIQGEQFYHDERYARAALKLAGVETSPFRAWLEDWSLSEQSTTECTNCLHVKLQAASEDFSLQLVLRNQRDPVLHGDRGLSQKSDTPGNASYYYSYPRLLTEGMIIVNGTTFTVSGSSWFDHEWSTSALEAQQTGWDWFSLQLSDHSELMLFRLRHRDPGRSRYSGTLITDDAVINLDGEKFTLRVMSHWRSPHSKVRYPQVWQIDIPSI